MAPMSLIERSYGQTVLMEELNKLVSGGLRKYITDNQLRLLGEPIPFNLDQQSQDLENPNTFEFTFEIGLAPQLSFTLSKDDTVPYYTIGITDEDKEVEKESLLKSHRKLVALETVDENAFLQVDLIQGDRIINDALIALEVIENSAHKEAFIGKKVGDEWLIDVKQIFTNETDLADLLHVKKEELADMEPLFTVKIKAIEYFPDVVLNQELYDQLFGKDIVTNEEEFAQKLEERLRYKFWQYSETRFSIDAYKMLASKANVTLPDDFLKRWLQYSSEEKVTPEAVEADYPEYAAEFRRRLINHHIMKEQNIEITVDDLLEQAKKIILFQFSLYGIGHIPDENLTSYASNFLADEKKRETLRMRVERNRIIDYVKASVTLDIRSIFVNELQDLYMREGQSNFDELYEY